MLDFGIILFIGLSPLFLRSQQTTIKLDKKGIVWLSLMRVDERRTGEALSSLPARGLFNPRSLPFGCGFIRECKYGVMLRNNSKVYIII